MAFDDRDLHDLRNVIGELHLFLERENGIATGILDRRSSKELARVHEQGWKLVAEAIRNGLRGIEETIRKGR